MIAGASACVASRIFSAFISRSYTKHSVAAPRVSLCALPSSRSVWSAWSLLPLFDRLILFDSASELDAVSRGAGLREDWSRPLLPCGRSRIRLANSSAREIFKGTRQPMTTRLRVLRRRGALASLPEPSERLPALVMLCRASASAGRPARAFGDGKLRNSYADNQQHPTERGL